jgi:thiol-disulfide isomerase/thioredoxin
MNSNVPMLPRRRFVAGGLALLGTAALATAPRSATAASGQFDDTSWNTILQRHAGKPLVVHFWGLTCPPCLVELPDWAKLERGAPHARFVYVQAERQPAARGAATLAKAGLGRSEQWAFGADANEERLRFAVDPRWRGELPKTVLVAPDGAVTPMRDGTDFARIRAWLATHGTGR